MASDYLTIFEQFLILNLSTVLNFFRTNCPRFYIHPTVWPIMKTIGSLILLVSCLWHKCCTACLLDNDLHLDGQKSIVTNGFISW